MLNVNNTEIRTKITDSILVSLFLTYKILYTPFSSVSTAEFELVITSWVVT